MSELGKALGNSVAGHRLESLGKTYCLSLVDQKVKVEYEKRLYKCGREAVTALRADMTSEEYVQMLSKLCECYESGEFAMEGIRGKKALNSPRGAILLMSLLMGCDEHEAMNVMAANPHECAGLLESVLKESFPGLKFKEKEPGKGLKFKGKEPVKEDSQNPNG